MPAPPMPAIQKRRPSSGEGNEFLRNLVRGVRASDTQHRLGHLSEASAVAEQRADDVRRARGVGFRDDDGRAGTLEVARVLRLVVCRSERAGNEDSRPSCSGELPHGAAGTRQHDVARTERRTELLGECEQAIVRARYARRELLVVARPTEMQNGRAFGAESVERKLVQQRSAERAAEDQQDRTRLRQAEEAARLVPGDGKRAGWN